jgi:Uma2 family endonuclease
MTINITEPQVHLLTRVEYYDLVDAGYFEGRRVELLEGRIFEMPAMKAPHATSLTLTEETLGKIVTGRFFRIQMPLSLTSISEPEPDIAIIAHDPLDYSNEHPATAAMVVEIADSSLRLDRMKAASYASAGVPDYWIVNLQDRNVEVYRDAVRDLSSEPGFRYASQLTFSESESVVPLLAPGSPILVKEFLPRRASQDLRA